MDERPEWFSAKRFGYGSAMPCSWQGWVVVIIYFAIAIGGAYAFAKRPVILISILVPLTAIFLVICFSTTEGGWRWRWGDKD